MATAAALSLIDDLPALDGNDFPPYATLASAYRELYEAAQTLAAAARPALQVSKSPSLPVSDLTLHVMLHLADCQLPAGQSMNHLISLARGLEVEHLEAAIVRGWIERRKSGPGRSSFAITDEGQAALRRVCAFLDAEPVKAQA
jgi:hypothetical protein